MQLNWDNGQIPLLQICPHLPRMDPSTFHAPKNWAFVLLNSLGDYFPMSWCPGKRLPALKIERLARAFDNVSLCCSFGKLWQRELPEGASISMKLLPQYELSIKRKENRGFGFLELLIVMLMFGILASMAVPNGVQLIRYDLRHQALLQMRAVRNAESQMAICAAQSIPCPGISAQIPAPGSIVTTGYTYTYAQNGNAWSYTASPVAQPNTSYYVDQSGLIRFSDSGSTAGPTSPVIQ